MSSVNQLFGLASSTAYIRCGGSGYYSQVVLESMAAGFGATTGDGFYVYGLFNANPNPFVMSGFDSSSSYYNSLELNVTGLGGLYQIGAAAIIYSYSNFSNIDENKIVDYINSYCTSLHGFLGGSLPKFSIDGLDYTLSKFSLTGINHEVAQVEGLETKKAINYNWYDSSPLFINTNNSEMATKIRDVENQYYYLSGELIYTDVPSDLLPCVQNIISIVSPLGDVIEMPVFVNTPCFDSSSMIAPITGVKFFRKFNDGPGSSGIFDVATVKEYIAFDEAALNPLDYSSNNVVAYSRYLDNSGNYIFLKSGVQMDVHGFYNSGHEYGPGITNWISEGCTAHAPWPLMRMHQGDNLPKWNLYSEIVGTYPDTTCVTGGALINATGWKFAQFELDSSHSDSFSSLEMNPKMDVSRFLKRALNLENPYLNVGDSGDGKLSCYDLNYNPGYWVFPQENLFFGAPQLNGNFSIPGFAFYQTFDNITFPDSGRITIRPAINSNGGYAVSNFDLFSGVDTTNHGVFSPDKSKVKIMLNLNSSGITGYDDTFKKCLGMGDSFGSSVTTFGGAQENAGFSYSGFAYFLNGVPVSLSYLMENFSSALSTGYSAIRYLRNYLDGSGNEFFPTTKQADYITGDTSTGINYVGTPLSYSYFDNGVLGAVNTGWLGAFCPIPKVVLDDYNSYARTFSGVYEEQKVENYLPRYSNGPYLSYKQKFLYPNAKSATGQYDSLNNGFPNKVYYEIYVQEETVREIFKSGSSASSLDYIKVIRPSGSTKTEFQSTFSSPFIPDDARYSRKYSISNTGTYPQNGSFNNVCSLGSFVDENYVPSRDFCSQKSVNSVIQNGYEGTPWILGVRQTGQIINRHLSGISGQVFDAFITEPAVGSLQWGYNARTITGFMDYMPPVFNLESGIIIPSQDYQNKINNTLGYYADNNSYYQLGGGRDILGKAKDPIFAQYINGRIGSGAQLEGGNHSEGIIGDAWCDFNGDFGITSFYCYGYYSAEVPENDSNLHFLFLTSGALNIYSKGMKYNPFYLDYSPNPFTDTISNIGVNNLTKRSMKQTPLYNNEYYFDFDLKQYFHPLKSGNSNNLYLDSGLTIGPFDRDVEFCVDSGNSIVPTGKFIVDGQILADSDAGWDYCPDYLLNIGNGPIIAPQYFGRNSLITTFKLIPKGSTVNINLSGGSLIGLNQKSIVTIRARKTFGANQNIVYSIFDDSYYGSYVQGDYKYLDIYNFINNGSEMKTSIPCNQFSDLKGQIITKVSSPRFVTYYPVPEADFDDILNPSFDAYGNKVYDIPNPTAYYWSMKDASIPVIQVRETSRVVFTVKNVSISGWTGIPYESYSQIIPYGNCLISGEFGYTGQAESAIITNGIVLSGSTGDGLFASSLSGLFQPIYVSDVMQRVPTGIYVIPSGTSSVPILPAPSYMKKRRYFSQITGGDSYIDAAPSSNSSYNEFLWPAWSDLAMLNPEVVYEAMPPDDGNVFLASHLTFSASQGQNIGTGINPIENVTYEVPAQYVFLDSTSTNAIYNSGKCIFSGQVEKTYLDSGDLSGILTSEGNSLTMAINLKI